MTFGELVESILDQAEPGDPLWISDVMFDSEMDSDSDFQEWDE